MQLAYLVDIFCYLNQLNPQYHGSENEKFECVGNIFVFENRLCVFLCKTDLWIGKVEEKLLIFSTLKTLANDRAS